MRSLPRVLAFAFPALLMLLAAKPVEFLRAQTAQTIAEDASLARRRATLDVLLSTPTRTRFTGRINAADKTWEEWVRRTGELPPDFATMPSQAYIPDPLVPLGNPRGARIRTRQEWTLQRQRIRAEFERWVFGKMPPAPMNLRSSIVSEEREGDALVQNILLEFGPEHKATLRLQVIIPPGKGPFPVFLTNHPRRRPWVNTAVRRGYVACIVYAVDPYYRNIGAEDDSDAWIEIYPDYDFSMIARSAWGAMRAVDYLTTRKDVDSQQIGITGHSRNSKGALLAAAFDERIAAVVPSRGNSGDQIPWRLSSDIYLSESMRELTTGLPNWFHPRLRFFVGNEHKLPVDQNMLLSLIAPRGLMFSHAFTEHQGNVLGIEESYKSVKNVYQFLGHPERLGLYQQPGEHESSPEDVEVYLDFFDTVFGRHSLPVPDMWVRNYSYEKWRTRSRESINPSSYPVRRIGDFMTTASGQQIDTPERWLPQRAAIQDRIRWMLGDEPAGISLPTRTGQRGNYMTYEGHLGSLLPRNQGRGFSFGDNLRGFIHAPEGVNVTARIRAGQPVEKYPVVIWLHSYSYATGYSRWARYTPLVRRGFVVASFDQIGFGSRSDGALKFYDRYPHWSLMGRMVADVRAAISMLSSLERVDPARIYLAGYGLGGKLGLLTAALDDRVAGVISISGFAPLRIDTPDSGTEGVRHYSHLHGLTPRLGFFEGRESRLPVDWDEIIAAVAPRPVWVGTSRLDRFNPFDDVQRAVTAARETYRVYDSVDQLQFHGVTDFDALPDELMRGGVDWLGRLAGLPPEVPAAEGPLREDPSARR